MEIDWFTFGAQIFNFVLLVYLLKRFLYRPILDTVERRENRIRDRLEKARRKEEEAKAERERYRSLQEDLERTRSSILRAAEEEAAQRRRELAEEVRSEARAERDAWRESLRRQRDAFLEEMESRMSGDVAGLVERVVGELADADLEDRLIDVFLERLEGFDGVQRDEFSAAAVEEETVKVRSSFPLSPDQRERIEGALEGWIRPPGPEPEWEIQWEELPDLSLGIQVRAGDRKISWSVDDYLDVLQTETAAYLDAEAR